MDLFKLRGVIDVDNKNANKQLNETGQEGEKAQSKLSKAFSGIGKGAVAVGKAVGVGMVAAGTAVAALTTKSIQAYADYEQLVGGVDTLFKESSSKVQEYAKNAYKTAGLSANEYMETVTSFSASLLQSLGGDTEKAADKANLAITDMSDNANKMGTSMEAIQNAYQGFAKQNYTMLDNLKLGYGGTKEEMARLLADAEKLSGQKFDISSYADVVEAIHVIQTEMGITGTTAKEAASTISGSIGMMKSSWQNLLTAISSDDLPFGDYVTQFVDSVTAVTNNLMPRIQIALNGVVQLIEKIVPVILAKIPEMLSSLLPAVINAATGLLNAFVGILPQLVSALGDMLPSLATGIVDVLKSIANALPEILETVIDVAFEIINTLASMLPEVLPLIMDVITQIPYLLIDALPMLIDAAMNVITGLLEALPTMLQMLAERLPEMVNDLLYGALPDIISKLTEMLPQIITSIITLLTDSIPMLIDTVLTIIDSIVEQLPVILDALVSALKTNLPLLIDGVIQLVMGIVQALPEIMQALIDALPTIIQAIVEAVMALLPDIIAGAIKLVLALVEALPYIFEALILAVPLIFESIWAAIKGVFAPIGEWLNNKIIQPIKDGFNKVKENVSNIITSVKDKVSSIFNGIKSNISNVINSIKSTVTNVFNGIKDAMSKPIEKARDLIKGIVDKIKGFFSGMKISFPKIKLPHFSVKPKGWAIGDLLKGSIPKLGIDWYAKAMNSPMIMNKPTIFGYDPKSGNVQAGGEAGSEMVGGVSAIMNMISAAVASQMDNVAYYLQKLIEMLAEYFPEILEAMDRPISFDPEAGAVAMAVPMDRQLGIIKKQKERGR